MKVCAPIGIAIGFVVPVCSNMFSFSSRLTIFSAPGWTNIPRVCYVVLIRLDTGTDICFRFRPYSSLQSILCARLFLRLKALGNSSDYDGSATISAFNADLIATGTESSQSGFDICDHEMSMITMSYQN